MPAQYGADEVREMVESGVCEPSRLLHILGMITAGRPLYNSDMAYLDRIASRLADKESALRRENRRIRRVLGGARPAEGAAAGRPASAAAAPSPPPAPVIDAAARRGAAPATAPAGRRAPSTRSQLPRETSAPRQAPAGRKPRVPPSASAAPATKAAPAAGRALIDDASLDAILERRDRQRRSGARERAAEAVAAPRPDGSPPAGSPPPPRGRLAGRLRGMVAGRR